MSENDVDEKEEERKRKNRERYREWYAKHGHDEKYIQHKKEQHKEYYSRPEIKEYIKKYDKEYHSRPEVKKHYKEQQKEYHSRPEVKEHMKEYYSRPEVKKHKKEYNKEYDTALPLEVLEYIKSKSPNEITDFRKNKINKLIEDNRTIVESREQSNYGQKLEELEKILFNISEDDTNEIKTMLAVNKVLIIQFNNKCQLSKKIYLNIVAKNKIYILIFYLRNLKGFKTDINWEKLKQNSYPLHITKRIVDISKIYEVELYKQLNFKSTVPTLALEQKSYKLLSLKIPEIKINTDRSIKGYDATFKNKKLEIKATGHRDYYNDVKFKHCNKKESNFFIFCYITENEEDGLFLLMPTNDVLEKMTKNNVVSLNLKQFYSINTLKEKLESLPQ